MQIWPLAEPPKSFILFSGMAMLGAVLGRKVHFEGDPHRTYPLMNLLLIGPSGIGKSTALRDIAMNHLVTSLPDDLRPQVITGKSTKEALHEDLMSDPHSIILASELSNFFSKEKYQEGMIPYVTDLLDLAPARVRTKSGGSLVVEKPECCILGGSTKAWLQDQLPSNAGEGGFLPRFFIVKEDYKGQRVPDPRRVLSRQQRFELEKNREHVFATFRALCRMHEGIIDFDDYEASDEYGIWYQTYLPETGNLAPFAARAGAHVIRLAILSAISCERTAIAAEDVRAAIKLHAYSMEKLQEIVVPMTPAGKMVNRVLDALGGEAMSLVQVRRAMRNYCSAQDTDKLVEGLMMSKDVTYVDGKYRRNGR